ncbi:MAG: CHAT domain-containing protein, partial [Moorea sp. SIO2B7]|nr:CHAT domain-containing protein [Moorena sp. SIO2B7]
HEFYFGARQDFAEVGAIRGEAMAILRLAYLDAIASKWNLASHGYQEARHRVAETGDRLNFMTATMGKCWTSLQIGEWSEDLIGKIEATSRVAKDNDAIAYGISWGLAFAYAGRDALDNNEDVIIALRAARLAHTIFALFNTPEQQEIILRAFGGQDIMETLYGDLIPGLADIGDWEQIFAVANNLNNSNLETLSLNEIAAYLPQGVLLLAYLILEQHLVAWGITSEGLVGQYNLDQFDTQPFNSSLFIAHALEWIDEVSGGIVDSTSSAALVQSLLEPFDAQIAAANHLLIVPFTEEFKLFPFNALPWQYQPLGKQKTISYLPSPSLLNKIPSLDPTTKGALVVGNPDFVYMENVQPRNREFINSLPVKRIEAELIADLYQVKSLIGIEATKEAVMAEIARTPKIIHLATGGYFQTNNSILGVPLAEGKSLSSEDFISLKLKADLVILSAGYREQSHLRGHSLTELAQSIIQAGARAVCVNLWSADDLATAIIMQLLHKGLLAGESPAQALWEAQQQLCQITVQQALDFCQVAQAKIPWQKEADRADRAIFTKYMGELMAFGGDYPRAAEAYAVAINILNSVGRSSEAETLQSEQRRYKLLAVHSNSFNPEQLIFNSPEYWVPFVIIGDWH